MQIKQVPIATLGMAPANCDPSLSYLFIRVGKNVVLFTPHSEGGQNHASEATLPIYYVTQGDSFACFVFLNQIILCGKFGVGIMFKTKENVMRKLWFAVVSET